MRQERYSLKKIIGFAQISSTANLDEARAGFFKALADSGVLKDSSVTVIERNAQGDVPALALIMQDFIQQGATHVMTIASVTTQAALKSITDRPHIFGAVANPYIIGAGTSPTSHRPNVTGAEIPLPVDSAVALAHEAFPKVKAWGTLFDPSDPFAEFYLEEASKSAAAQGVKWITVACTSAADIGPGIQALKAQGAGGVVQIPSVMIGGGFAAVVKATRQAGLPLVATTTSFRGAPIALGLSFYQNGYNAGLLMIRVLHGENPANIPFQRSTQRIMIVDLDAAREYGLAVPPEIASRADTVYNDGAKAAKASNGSAANQMSV